tara:strand:- start:255 stop:380 length:126 start_codon:yes stop_codon:yes gene_type:complete
MAKYKTVTLKEIAANNFSLSPKDYIKDTEIKKERNNEATRY